MILLTTTSDLLELTTGSSVSSITCQASFIDLSGAASVTPNRTNTVITSATTTTIVGSPASSTQRAVKTVNIANTSGSSCAVTVKHTDGTNVTVLFSYTMLTGESVQWTEGRGWSAYDSSGNQKITAASANVASALQSATTVVSVSGATAPSNGQVLTATSSTTATWQAASGGFSDPMTTTGDIIYSSSGTPTPARLGIGTAGQILVTNSGASAPAWSSTLSANYSFTGTPTFSNALALGSSTATTQSPLNNTTNIATTAYVDNYEFGVNTAQLRDDFICAAFQTAITDSAGGISTYGQVVWNAQSITASTGTAEIAASTAPQAGVIALTSGSAASGDGISLYVADGGMTGLATTVPWQLDIIFKISTTSSVAVRCGFEGTADLAAVALPANGLWVEYDTSNTGNTATDFTWVASKASAIAYNTTHAIAANTNYNHIQISSTVAGTINYVIGTNNGALGTAYSGFTSTNIPTVALVPFMQIVTKTTAAVTLSIDLFSFIWNTGRV